MKPIKELTGNKSQDPTHETQGPMRIILSNQTDLGGTSNFPAPMSSLASVSSGLNVYTNQASLTYGGSGTPPQPWVKGTDWKVTPNSQLAPVGFPVATDNEPKTVRLAGSAAPLLVASRAAGKVALGGQYVFDLPFFVRGTYLSVHFTILGVTGGSTVLPGFGLFNLGSNPRAWTYVTPTAFDGIWSLLLRSDDFLDYARLAVTYVPYGGTNQFGPTSRLVYSVSGLTTCYGGGIAQGEERPEHSSLGIFRAAGALESAAPQAG